MNGPRYPLEEISRRAKEIYATIKHRVNFPENIGKILAIDIESGDYEVADNRIAATDAIRDRQADPEIFIFRIGYRAATWFGGAAERVEL